MKDFETSDPALYNELVCLIESSIYNEEDDNSVEEFIENQEKIRNFHKYIAIIQADGDNVGKIIQRIGKEPEAIKAFSKKLMGFSMAASEIVWNYGGSPVYMGGDDMLFFAPLICNGKNILHLIEELDEKFNKSFNEEIKATIGNQVPSVSFGISLSYYKFPLNEAKTMAFEALFHEIKTSPDKNAVNIKFRKHSGQMHERLIKKHDRTVWKKIIEFINFGTEDDSFLNSFTNKLRLQEEVLFSKIADVHIKLEYYFKNNFNENYEAHKAYYQKIAELITDINKSKTNNNTAIELLYSVLKFTHFLRS